MTRGERVDARRNNRERSGKPTVACVQPVPCPITSCHGGTPPPPPYARSASSLLARSKARTTPVHAACKRANICTRPRSCVSIDGVGKCVMCFAPFGKYQSLGFWIGGDPCWTGFENVCSAYLANDTLCKWTWLCATAMDFYSPILFWKKKRVSRVFKFYAYHRWNCNF